MFLTRITMNGFKSFADRTEFEFGSGVTCVVGPNGCGKSNLLDALRWVLGEQSARSLRGSKMLDVIFAGSRSRKPLNFAEVELTFDNSGGRLACDDRDVVVGRVLYRNGDSEYRLNGKICRRKDIRDLLLDTGVGVGAYSIIEQGRVDQLLQAGPVERREIFEEAAGISRYKVRRAEAQRKLERSQNNLLRLADVIEELERHLRSVKLAAGKARRYQEHDQRLRELQSSYSLAEYDGLVTRLAEAQAEVRGVSDRLHARRSELATRDAEAAQLQHELQDSDERIQAADEALIEQQTELSALRERISQEQRRLEELADQREQRRSEAAEAAGRTVELRRRIESEQTQFAALAEEAERQTARIEQLTEHRREALESRERASAELERAKAAMFESARESALLHNEHENLTQQETRLLGLTERLAQRERELADERNAQATRRDDLSRQAETVAADADAKARTLRELEQHLEQLRRRGEQLDEEIGRLRESRSAITSRIELLEDLERRHAGVDAGTQAVLEWGHDPQACGGVLGLVADLLRIDDPRVECLQAVLNTFEGHVVTADAYGLLAELQRRGELPGPLRIIALDRVTAPTRRDSYDSAPGVVARASDWVVCDAAHSALARHLLGRVLVVDRLERALALAGEAPEGYTFVTLDGLSVSSSGRLTAGPQRGAPGLISRKAEIRRLHGERDEIETNLERETRRRKEIEATSSDAALQRPALLEEIATLQRQHAQARAALTHLEEQTQRLEREVQAVRGELAGSRAALSDLREKLAALRDRETALAEAHGANESSIGTLERALGEREEALAQAAQALTDAKVAGGRTNEKRSASEQVLLELRERLTTLQTEQAEADTTARRVAERITRAEQDLEQTRLREADAAAACQRNQQQVGELRGARQDIRRRLEASGAAARELHARIAELDDGLRAGEVRVREIEVRRDGLVERVRDDLDIDLVPLHASYERSERDWEATRQEIDELRQKITRLGNVNLDAIAELEELTPRHENLVTQRDDLVSSIERLEALIEELNVESRTRFLDAFDQIREHFQELFRKLFGGGKADVILENPDDPLECGIDIIARPPGKEPQSISLLSGGEKTLAAVSLLLAVFKSKPSPFAVLDEVDAALDESNVERFNIVVQEFLAHSQFVIITHNKRTMQSADVMYGITMEEPGVSKRVSVRFDDRVETPSVA